jgi:UDP-glucose 4-epimerase
MNILVTGGAGYVGSVCSERLIADGHKVVVLDNLSSGHRASVPGDAVFIEGDFGDVRLCRDLIRHFGIDAVMHFAGETLVEKSMTDPRSYFTTNIKNGIDFLNCVTDGGVKNLIFSSTAAVYGEPKQIPITESHQTEPINAYGDSKLMFERILDWYHRAYGLRYTALRYFNASGATELLGEDHHPESHLVPRLLESIYAGSEFVVFGDDYPTPDGTCIRDYVHVSDIAQAHVLAASALLANGTGGVFNIGSGKGNSIKEVIAIAETVVGQSVKFRQGPRRAGDPAVLVASNEKLSRVLGWKPKCSSLTEILKSAWQWKKAHAEGYSPHERRSSMNKPGPVDPAFLGLISTK